MEFRDWLLNEELVASKEGTATFPRPTAYDPHNWDSKSLRYKIYKNPSPTELRSSFEYIVNNELDSNYLAGFVDRNGDVFIWPRTFKPHETMASILGKVIHVSFYVYPDGTIETSGFSTPSFVQDPHEEAMSNPYVKRMLGREEPVPKAG
jgi:hypothetical protein